MLLAEHPALPELGRGLEAALGRGTRVGESAVASVCVHTLDPARPGRVAVLGDRDAGQTFYGRSQTGQVLHLDVFHAVGEVDCRAAGAAVREALAAYRRDFPSAPDRVAADLFDVQTATGGGRASGRLTWGRRPSLRRAHRNHVHVAGRFVPGHAAVTYYLVVALERCIGGQGLQIRRVDEVVAELAGPGGGWQDLSPYASESDSLLKGDGGRGEAGGAGRSDGAGEGDRAPGPDESLLSDAARLADELGGAAAVSELLALLARGTALQDTRSPTWGGTRLRDALSRLQREGWAESAGGRWRLTARGRRLETLYRFHLREIEVALRSAARRLAVGRPGAAGARPREVPGHRGSGRRILPRPAGEPLGELAVSESLVAAVQREVPRPGRPLSVQAGDLRVARRLRPRRVDLCLLLDASASMEGGRMRAAKVLARHLLLTSRDRVAVMAFQERSAELAVGFTRNYAAAERGLSRIHPSGLTPLAAGLARARTYLQASHAKNPLLLLVTDGIPTVSATGGSPLEEALHEANAFRDSGVSLCCIGLEPNERYLRELARRAGGMLHVVAELRPELMAPVAERERQRLRQGGS